ncbi:S8 family serine peptidase [Opitutus terrae]|uniref:Peptidase S8 and S53 subtilisin kexin sedolisin n=1 Tax=Opitutus terrae (strain DSM 11246 / JCM 15787 / PB90-1) TaxID=452637 RepID=B1ZMP7_OPITP|nr:S8 family serine peptidase [Opitutus terrae]ACB75325.1 peptidase S8 and S53 subtilisin kexin sedolisin [Opitutus terrae PB90-1]
MLDWRITAGDSPGVIRREWLLRTGDPNRGIRVEEEVRLGTTADHRETVLRRDAFVADEILVRAQPTATAAEFSAALVRAGARSWRPITGSGYWLARWPAADLDTQSRALAALARESNLILAAEPNGLGTTCDTPTDERFSEQYSLNNTGQTGGTPGADIRMLRAWDIRRTCPDVVVAVLDVGVDFSSPDLAPNRYRNRREIPDNGADDDQNGYVDDWSGWDTANNDNDPEPSGDHGTGAASVLAARGNNDYGIAGITWEVQLLPVKVRNALGEATTASLIAGIEFARISGARIMSMSLAGYPYSQATLAAIERARDADILLVIAASNAGTDNDVFPYYPASYPSDNILAVANTDHNDQLNLALSCYGRTSVDLGAPGTRIRGLSLNGGYRYGNGTSSAVPHVAGVAALLRQMRPEATVADLRDWILSTIDPLPSLAGRCVSGGRLNAYAALRVAQNLPVISQSPQARTGAPCQSAEFTIGASSELPFTYQWRRNGTALAGATSDTLTLPSIQPADTGIVDVVLANSTGAKSSAAVALGLVTTGKALGLGDEVLRDIFVPSNGHTYDQVLLTGAAVAITADHALGQITRLSFLDLDDDIVQVELSGPGTLSLVLDDPTGPASPRHYEQTVAYMKGHAGIVIAGATEATHVSVFSVGRITAVNQSLFRAGVSYDGIADLAFIAITSTDGRFGGLRAANATFFAHRGLTGIHAPDVQFNGPVYVGDISAFDAAAPVLMLGGATGDTRITGGDLEQPNAQPVQVSGLTQLRFTAGTDSHGNTLSAQSNRATLQQDGIDVTARIVVNPSP